MPGKRTELDHAVMNFAIATAKLEKAAGASGYYLGKVAATVAASPIDRMVARPGSVPDLGNSAPWPELLHRWLSARDRESMATRNPLEQGQSAT